MCIRGINLKLGKNVESLDGISKFRLFRTHSCLVLKLGKRRTREIPVSRITGALLCYHVNFKRYVKYII